MMNKYLNFFLLLFLLFPSVVLAQAIPCKDSSTECVELLTEKAIANSTEILTTEERIKMIEERLKLMERKIKYSRKRSWTNYITLDPIELIQNIFGGGGVQRDRIALADLDVSVGQLEAAKAELERQKERQKAILEAEVLRLVLNYEASSRRRDLIKVQLNTFQKQQQIELISYRLGQVESSGAIMLRPSLLEPCVQLSLHTAPEQLAFRLAHVYVIVAAFV